MPISAGATRSAESELHHLLGGRRIMGASTGQSPRYCVLGMLVARPGYGYELVDRCRRQLGPGWQLSESHVYFELERLESAGLVARRVGPGKRTYFDPTSEGRAEFERWMTEGSARALQPLRNDLYPRLAVSQPRHYRALIELISAHVRQITVALDEVSAELTSAAGRTAARPIAPDQVALEIILNGQMGHLEAELAWLQGTRRTLEWLKGQDGRFNEAEAWREPPDCGGSVPSMWHCLLGLLDDRADYRYELVDRCRRQLGPGWQLRTSYVYTVLDRLESAGLVSRRVGPGNRMYFDPTSEGRAEFERSMTGGNADKQPLRNDLYLRLAVSQPRHYQSLIELIFVHQRQLGDAFKEASAELASAAAASTARPIAPDRVGREIILNGQMGHLEAELAWLRGLHGTLEWLKGQDVRSSEASARGARTA